MIRYAEISQLNPNYAIADLEVPEVVDGLIYNLTVRMEYPGLLTGCKNDVSYGVSRWSKPMTLRTPSGENTFELRRNSFHYLEQNVGVFWR